MTCARSLGVCVLAAVLLTSCAADRVVNGRPYALLRPDGADGTTPLPLVVLLHGFGANGALQESFFNLSEAMDEKDYLLALPNGTLDRNGRRFWNGAEACCQPEELSIDDVSFLRAVIEDVKTQHPVDDSRIFLVGHSNGGFMALRMACEAGDLVDGVVSVAGASFDDFSRCPSGPTVPVLQLHGTTDKVIRFDGGDTAYGVYPGAVETTQRFAARNGCGATRGEAGRLDLESTEGEETVREPWLECPPGAAVELWRMEGVGHLPDFNDAWAAEIYEWLEANQR